MTLAAERWPTFAGPDTARTRSRRHGVAVVWGLELTKISRQLRVRAVVVLCVAAPFLVLAAVKVQSAVPQDTLFGQWLHESGFALPMVVVGFTGQWVLPLLTCIVAGDIFAAEDHFGTWKTVLTRSRTARRPVRGEGSGGCELHDRGAGGSGLIESDRRSAPGEAAGGRTVRPTGARRSRHHPGFGQLGHAGPAAARLLCRGSAALGGVEERGGGHWRPGSARAGDATGIAGQSALDGTGSLAQHAVCRLARPVGGRAVLWSHPGRPDHLRRLVRCVCHGGLDYLPSSGVRGLVTVRGSRRGCSALAAVALAGGLLVSACSSTGVVPNRLQSSIAETFSNLYVLQQVQQGNPRPDVHALRTKASCQKGTPSSPQNGAGDDWVCDITYLVAGPATPVTAIYNVNVQTDGCYAADGDGPASVNGSRTITGPHYQAVVNPLWLIDGCFDIT